MRKRTRQMGFLVVMTSVACSIILFPSPFCRHPRTEYYCPHKENWTREQWNEIVAALKGSTGGSEAGCVWSITWLQLWKDRWEIQLTAWKIETWANTSVKLIKMSNMKTHPSLSWAKGTEMWEGGVRNARQSDVCVHSITETRASGNWVDQISVPVSFPRVAAVQPA